MAVSDFERIASIDILKKLVLKCQGHASRLWYRSVKLIIPASETNRQNENAIRKRHYNPQTWYEKGRVVRRRLHSSCEYLSQECASKWYFESFGELPCQKG